MIAGCYFLPPLVYSQTTYVDNGTSTTYTLQAGDSLYIRQGTFTGTVNNWNTGGRITVASGATYRPNSVNGYRSKYTVYGTMIVSSLQGDGQFGLNNYGVVTINGTTQLNSSAQAVVNNVGAVINFNGAVSINAGGSSLNNYGIINMSAALNLNADNIRFANYADITIGGDFNLYSSSYVINNKNLNIEGNFNSSKGQINNQGKFFSKRVLTIGGSTTFTNTCRTIADNGISINNNSATVYNSGLLLSSNASSFVNNGRVFNSGNAVIKSGVFTNYGSVSGNGNLYILGKSTLGGSASVGSSASTTDSLKIYTVNRTKTTQVFDDQWGTVYANAKYAQFTAPDTTGFSAYTCAVEYRSMAVLPLSWTGFSVKITNTLPLINWAADFDEATIFTVQRSWNGIDFSSISTITAKGAIKQYDFVDNTLSTDHGSIIYYRVCANLASGIQKYTEIKSVKFEQVKVVKQFSVSPNPFSNTFNLMYNSTQKQTLIIKVFNFNGQVVYTKSVSANAGNNSIAVSDTGKWINGMYIIQVIAANEPAMSIKIIKQ